jgi:hypothetical protein
MKNNTLLILIVGVIVFLIYRNGVKVNASSTIGLNQGTSNVISDLIKGVTSIFSGRGTSNSASNGTNYLYNND